MLEFHPRPDCMLIERIEPKTTTKSGLAIVSDSDTLPVQQGLIVSIGSDCGEYEQGFTVLYSKFSGRILKLNGNSYILLKYEDVLGYVTGKED